MIHFLRNRPQNLGYRVAHKEATLDYPLLGRNVPWLLRNPSGP